MVGDVGDVITCAEFQIEIFMGYDFTGVEFSIFLLILALQQCSATVTALPVPGDIRFVLYVAYVCSEWVETGAVR